MYGQHMIVLSPHQHIHMQDKGNTTLQNKKKSSKDCALVVLFPWIPLEGKGKGNFVRLHVPYYYR
jgi:hypothetical protein